MALGGRGGHLSYQAAELGERNPLLLILVATAATPAPTTAAISTAATVAAATPSAKSALEATTVRHVTGVCSDINKASLVGEHGSELRHIKRGVRRQVGRRGMHAHPLTAVPSESQQAEQFASADKSPLADPANSARASMVRANGAA